MSEDDAEFRHDRGGNAVPLDCLAPKGRAVQSGRSYVADRWIGSCNGAAPSNGGWDTVVLVDNPAQAAVCSWCCVGKVEGLGRRGVATS